MSPASAHGDQEVLDSHVHFWDPRRLTYPWLTEIAALDRPFTPARFTRRPPADVIFVEAGRAGHEADAEVEWIRGEARDRPWIRGVVAHAPLDDPAEAGVAIARCSADSFIVGVRRNIQDEAVGFTAGEDFRAGMRLLGDAGIPFDACVRAHQLPELAELAAACPRTTIVLDHLGKPSPGGPGDPSWRQAMRRLARHGNVVCKLSGLATEAAPGTTRTLLISALREALEIFGPDRCLYGSDWPVMTLATDYESWLDLVRGALAAYPPAATEAVLHGNATRTYRLDRATSSLERGTRKTSQELRCQAASESV